MLEKKGLFSRFVMDRIIFQSHLNFYLFFFQSLHFEILESEMQFNK